MNETFKYDVRVRERMIERGQLTEAEVQKHLEALADREGQAEEVGLAQPALGDEAFEQDDDEEDS